MSARFIFTRALSLVLAASVASTNVGGFSFYVRQMSGGPETRNVAFASQALALPSGASKLIPEVEALHHAFHQLNAPVTPAERSPRHLVQPYHRRLPQLQSVWAELQTILGPQIDAFVQACGKLSTIEYPNSVEAAIGTARLILDIVEPIAEHPLTSIHLFNVLVADLLPEARYQVRRKNVVGYSPRHKDILRSLEDRIKKVQRLIERRRYPTWRSHLLPEGFDASGSEVQIKVIVGGKERELTIRRIISQAPLDAAEASSLGFEVNDYTTKKAQHAEAIAYAVYEKSNRLVAYSIAYPSNAHEGPRWSSPDTLYLAAASTRPEYRNAGLWSTLTEKTIREARSRGYDAIRATIESEKENPKGRRPHTAEMLIRDFGFKVIDVGYPVSGDLAYSTFRQKRNEHLHAQLLAHKSNPVAMESFLRSVPAASLILSLDLHPESAAPVADPLEFDAELVPEGEAAGIKNSDGAESWSERSWASIDAGQMLDAVFVYVKHSLKRTLKELAEASEMSESHVSYLKMKRRPLTWKSFYRLMKGMRRLRDEVPTHTSRTNPLPRQLPEAA